MLSEITDQDISRVEQLLLPAGEHFDEQRRDIIRCIHSVDVNACPGSGKTTLMIAKLLLLASQMPFKSNLGICVLTHTNIAINEIKVKLGLSDSAIFRYPNHFGTIQSFINKFVGIPGYMAKFQGNRPAIIEQSWYENITAAKYRSWNGAGKAWISRQTDPVALLQSYKFNSNFDNLLKKIGGEPVFQNNGPAFTDLFNFKMRIMQEGILSYDDAYILAENYLKSHPKVKVLIQKRFPLLIIDEMQDTDTHQLSLLNSIFNSSATIIQRIGDYNQAIFNKVTNETIWNIGNLTLPLNGSKRFSTVIANQIDRICPSPRNMIGNGSIPQIQPSVILFKQTNILQVLPLFGNMVIEKKIPEMTAAPCKAVGWVKETTPAAGEIKNCIKSYWPDYSVSTITGKNDFNNLSEYLIKPETKIIELKGATYYWDQIIQIFLKVLRIAHVKTASGTYYSKTALTGKLKFNTVFWDELRRSLVIWIKEIQNNINPSAAINEFILKQFNPLFTINTSDEISKFLNNLNPFQNVLPQTSNERANIYHHFYDGKEENLNSKEVDISINTIHSVKGETHGATLYMETFYYNDDLKRILAYLKIGTGNVLTATQVRIIEGLKMAYVAMSRPTHFLCIAIRDEQISDGDIMALEAAGWVVNRMLAS